MKDPTIRALSVALLFGMLTAARSADDEAAGENKTDYLGLSHVSRS